MDSAGYGVSQAMQSILAGFVNLDSTGELFASSALIELLATLSGNFAFACFFDIGLNLAAPWAVGLPFFIAAVCLPYLFTYTQKLYSSLPSC